MNLTDDVGCTMKPNLLSPWLKTRQEKAVMAYRYEQRPNLGVVFNSESRNKRVDVIEH